mgnify:CR=1 FL=1|tara:strand:+ start:490 stop:717 length:228 start_codon:yes stop_codon:yes gene_type:complete
MQKKYFHNNKLEFKDKDTKKPSVIYNTRIKNVVDINILLNRVKIEKQTELKRKIIFYASVVLMLGLIITFITIIK